MLGLALAGEAIDRVDFYRRLGEALGRRRAAPASPGRPSPPPAEDLPTRD